MGKGSGSRDGSEAYYVRGGAAAVAPLPHHQEDDSHSYPDEPALLYSCSTDNDRHRWPKGMRNVGNSCYANAALQCLLSTALTHALLDPKAVAIFRRYSSNPNLLDQGSGSVDSDEEEDEDPELTNRQKRRKERDDRKMLENCQWLTRELKAITREYHDGDSSRSASSSFTEWFTSKYERVVNPESITRHPNRLSKCLRPYQQEDAHEFLRALLGTLVMNGQNRELSSLFDGLLESAVTCQTCLRPSLTRDRYMDLSLDISGHHIVRLDDALREFTKTETLTGDNKVYCQKCETKRTATKGLRLATAPSILVCHFKRFAFDYFGRLTRLSKRIKFPLKLEITEFMSRVNKARPPPYELVAVLVHQGQSCDSGHYLAYVKNNGDWFQCNDSEVKKVDVNKVLDQQAYILMYEVAEMRSNHGYPSPNKSSRKGSRGRRRTRSSSRSTNSVPNIFCGLEESLFCREFCFGMAACDDALNAQQPGPPSPTRHSRTDLARDDLSTLGESTVETKDSLRRSTSSGNIRKISSVPRERPSSQHHSRNHSLSSAAAIDPQIAFERHSFKARPRDTNNTLFGSDPGVATKRWNSEGSTRSPKRSSGRTPKGELPPRHDRKRK